MRHYEPTYFTAQEFLSPVIYKRYDDAGLYIAMDSRILWTADAIRRKTGKRITVNDWHDGGTFDGRGYRDSIDGGAKLSQHRFGRAFDFIIDGISADEFRAEMKKGAFDAELTYVTRCEEFVGMTWIHLDCAGISGTEILYFKP
jgi:hypothetical protein